MGRHQERWRKAGRKNGAACHGRDRVRPAPYDAAAAIDYHPAISAAADSWPRPAITLPPDHPHPTLPRLRGRVGWGASAVSSHDIFSKEIFDDLVFGTPQPRGVRSNGPSTTRDPDTLGRIKIAASVAAQAAASASRKPVHVEPPPLADP